MAIRSCVFALLAVLSLAYVARSAIPNDRVQSVPYYNGPPIKFDQYAGYITVDASHGRALYYWFVASQNNPSSAPVTLWLNGGPGCSSLDGFFYEHGPFHFDRTQPNKPINDSLHFNPYAWNNVSNVLYLESPAGVGFSYSNTTADYHTNDNKTAVDAYNFLVNWFAAYPEYASNDFYIAGESYAGIYVPTLAYYVHQQNQNSKNPKINLKGILVGNGVTDEQYDAFSYTQFAYDHALYSPNLYQKLVQNGCLTKNSGTCISLELEMQAAIGNVNRYDIYKNCYDGPPSPKKQHYYEPLRSRRVSPDEVPPCINSAAATEYLNDDSVRPAIHALPKSTIGRWAICSNKVAYTKIYSSVVPAYTTLAGAGYKILVYSGDTDGAVPYVGTVEWITAFEKGAKPQIDWKPWYVNDQVAGYVTKYPNLMFTTVKGAGHMVPQYKPEQAYVMFSGFLAGTFPPK